MRIAMLVYNLTGKGTYWRAYHFARELCARGHRVTLVSTAARARRRFRVTHEVDGRLALVEAPDLLPGMLRSGWDPWATVLRSAWLASTPFDIIHAFECRPTVILPALAIRARSGACLVIDWCDWFGRGGSVEERPSPVLRALIRPPDTFFETHFRAYADATTVINPFLGQMAGALGIPPASITTVPNGCDPDGWELVSPLTARTALGLPADTPLIGYVGAIFQRDAVLMAQAFDQLHARCPAARLFVLGYCNVAIEDLVQHPEAVLRTGPLDTPTLRRSLQACTLGWLPLCDTGANQGRWPMKMNTYMEAGLPFVATDVGDASAFVRRSGAGVVAAAHPADLAAQTMSLLNDPKRMAELGTTGRRLAETELHWSRITDRVEAVYQQLIASEG